MAARRKAAVLYTGGKDSTYACQCLLAEEYEVVCLVSLVSENPDSYMWHTAGIEVVELCARAMRRPLLTWRTRGEPETEVTDAADAVKHARSKFDFSYLASGGLASRYQKERVEKIAKLAGVEALSPLWGKDQEDYMRELLSESYEIMVTSVSAEGLGAEWLGRTLDRDSLELLFSLSRRFRFNAAFEGGEAETLVLDCPIFPTERVRVLERHVEWNGYFGRLHVGKADLTPKRKLGPRRNAH